MDAALILLRYGLLLKKFNAVAPKLFPVFKPSDSEPFAEFLRTGERNKAANDPEVLIRIIH